MYLYYIGKEGIPGPPMGYKICPDASSPIFLKQSWAQVRRYDGKRLNSHALNRGIRTSQMRKTESYLAERD